MALDASRSKSDAVFDSTGCIGVMYGYVMEAQTIHLVEKPQM